MKGWIRRLLLVLCLGLHSQPFSIQLREFDFGSPLPAIKIRQKPIEFQQLERIVLPRTTLQGIVSRLNLLKMVLDLNFNYKDLVPPVESMYFRLPLMSDNFV